MLVATKREAGSGALPWPAALIVWGPGEVSSPHAHHCVQLVLALSGVLRIRLRADDRWRRCGAVIIPPDRRHEVQARGAAVLIGFVDPESDLAAALLERLGSRVVVVPGSTVARWREDLGNPEALEANRVEEWVRAELLQQRRPRTVHARVKRVLRALARAPLDPGSTTLPSLASLAGLSPSRFMHAFTESVGIPLRQYLLWLRVQRAAAALTTGCTVTEAAYVAGFADAAHLTRTFRRMLGTTPTDLLRRTPATRELRLD
jgi:AraC-like DNA-binding protein